MTKKNLILSGFILLKFLLQYALINPYYDLHRDEYLHLDQGNHLAWGYLSLPPFTSWLAWLVQSLGNSIFWVKLFPALFGALTLLVVWKTVEALKGNLFALVLGATCTLFSILLRLNFLFQPNSFDVLSWTLFYFLLIKYFNTEKAKWLYIAAIVFSLGFLNKYNVVFLLIGILPSILLTRQRTIFFRKEFYISILISVLLILPNLVWQYNNNFPVVHHMKQLADTQLVNVNRWDFLKDQVFYFIGALPVILVSLYAFLFYEPFKKYKIFFWIFFFTLTAFIYFKAKSYYAIGLYPVYIAFGSAFIGGIQNTSWKKYLKPVAIAVPFLFYIFLYRLVYTIQSPEDVIKNKHVYRKNGLLRWEDGKDHTLPQDFADMLGWKELALKVNSIYTQLPGNEYTFILCDNYGQAGAINYYAKNKKIKAVTFHADYINWFDLDAKIENLIRVKEFEEGKTELEETSPFFNSASVAGSITNLLAREYGTTVFLFRKAKADINQKLKIELEEEKYERQN
jgi:hypothetical protein